MNDIDHPVRTRLGSGEAAIGIGVRALLGVEVARAMRTAGYDWLFLDLEHGAMSLQTASQIAVAALDAGIAPLVRVPRGDLSLAARALDNGALGVVMPHVDSAEEARAIVQALKFPPAGRRSIGGNAPQLGFRTAELARSTGTLNDALLTVVMIESAQALANAGSIAAVPGIDVLLLGANDLGADLGVHGDAADPRIADAVRVVATACAAHRKWAGIAGVADDDLLVRYARQGARFVLAGMDFNILMAAATRRSAALRSALAS
jgi:2-keto-3-deoxy-L-rhamnonate aldolase RhmA